MSLISLDTITAGISRKAKPLKEVQPWLERAGKWPWVIIGSCFASQFLTVGLAFSMGIFYTHWLDTFQEGKSLTAWIVSVNIAVLHFAAPVASVLINRFSHRTVVMMGSVLLSLGVFASAFAQNVYMLYFTYGVVAGIGFAFCYVPGVSIVGDYCVKNVRFALAFTAIGIGIGSLVFPPLLNFLIKRYGWRGGLILTSGITLQTFIYGALLRPVGFWTPSPKKEVTSHYDIKSLFNVELLKNLSFYVMSFHVCLFYLGILLPMLLLPDYARINGINSTDAAWLLSCIGICNTTARLLTAIVIDKLPCDRMILGSIINIAVGVSICFYQIYQTYWGFMLSSVLYGTIYGIYGSFYPVICLDLFGLKNLNSASGYLCVGFGLGSLFGTPMAGWLFELTGSYSVPFYTGGSMIVLAGFTLGLIPLYRKAWASETSIDEKEATVVSVS